MIGIRTVYEVAADVPFAASTALLTVGLKSPIAAGETQKIRAWVPLSTGAAGGVKCQLVVPAAVGNFILTSRIYDTVAQSDLSSVATASAPIADALANAGNHFLVIEATVENGVNAGDLDLQFAQDSAANTTTILKGAIMEVVKI